MRPPEAAPDAVERWSAELGAGRTLDEAQALALLRDFGLPAGECRVVDSEEALRLLCRLWKGTNAMYRDADTLKYDRNDIQSRMAPFVDEAELCRHVAAKIG